MRDIKLFLILMWLSLVLGIFLILNRQQHSEQAFNLIAPKDIYYIRGLRVTTESTTDIYIFPSSDSLEMWIAEQIECK